MITAQYIFVSIFLIILIYALIRPFSSPFSKMFLIFASILGVILVYGESNTTVIANYLGVGRGADLFLYLLIICCLLFSVYTLNKFSILEEKISKLAQVISIQERELKDKITD